MYCHIWYIYFLKPFCKKEKLYPEQVRYGGPKTNLKFRGFIDQMEFWNLSYLKDLEILMHVKKKFTLLAAQEAKESTKTFFAEWVKPAIIAFNSNILSIIFTGFLIFYPTNLWTFMWLIDDHNIFNPLRTMVRHFEDR